MAQLAAEVCAASYAPLVPIAPNLASQVSKVILVDAESHIAQAQTYFMRLKAVRPYFYCVGREAGDACEEYILPIRAA